MYYLEKRFTFAGGHRLSKHEKLCKNIHGHNYVVYVGIRSPELNENDMIIDFSDFKAIVNAYLDQYDHCLVVNKKDLHWMKPLADKMGFKTTIMDHGDRDPTAEVMAEIFFTMLEEVFKHYDIILDYVTVEENETSAATYRKG